MAPNICFEEDEKKTKLKKKRETKWKKKNPGAVIVICVKKKGGPGQRGWQSSFEDALLDLNDKEDQEIGNETTTFSLLDFEAT